MDRISGIAFRMYLTVFELSGQQWLAMAVAPQTQWDRAWEVMKPMLSTLHPLKSRPPTAPPGGCGDLNSTYRCAIQ